MIDRIRKLLALMVATVAIAPNSANAVVIDDFDHGDGTPLNITSTGEYQVASDTGLPSGSTVGTIRTSVVRTFDPKDQMHLSVDDPADGSAGLARVSGVITSGFDGPNAGLIWNGSTSGLSNFPLGLAPLDLSSDNAFSLEIAKASGHLRLGLLLINDTGQGPGVCPEINCRDVIREVEGPGRVLIPFTDFFGGRQVPKDFISNLGAITLVFWHPGPGAFDYSISSLSTVNVPEAEVPEPAALWLVTMGVTSLVSRRMGKALKRQLWPSST